MSSTHNLIGTAEAARILYCSPRTVHRRVKAGDLVPVMTAPGGYAGAYLFDREQIEAIAAAERSGAA